MTPDVTAAAQAAVPILLEVGRHGLIGGQEDMDIDIALGLHQQAQAQIHPTEAVSGP
ncbi:hypothetical protein NLM24_14185 [Nocardia zapadnayensis]|nr:hypothetical protein [Nocardia zapadnayensis]